MAEKEKIEKKIEEYQLVEVPTQMGIAFQSPSGEILTMEQAIIELLNKVDEIKKAIK